MKLIKILAEIGNRIQVPSGAKFTVGEYTGNVKFTLLDDVYTVEIRIPIKQQNRMAAVIDFFTENGFDMTNKNVAFKVLSLVVGALEQWFKQYNAKFGETGLIYISYNPKSEAGEIINASSRNVRDRFFKTYIANFSNKYNSDVTFTDVGGRVAKFKPDLIVK